jgi:gentisate 1,2-dioxygenase
VTKVDAAKRTTAQSAEAKPAAAKPAENPFLAELEAANLHPLWDRFKTLTPVRPQPKDPPLLWRWKDIEPLAERAVGQVAIDDVERRALILVNPAFAGATVTTSNLIAAFTVLDPGDRARPHRHTFAAIRFATRADGAATIVNGRRCAMRDGDLILTPPMCWHGHINESNHRIIWFDAANIPLLRTLDANFFEPGDASDQDFWRVGAGDESLWTEPGLVCADLPGNGAHSPKYHYSGESTRRLLSALPKGPDGAHTARYINPVTGGAVMPALDCYAVRLARAASTRPKRSTSNVICLVVSGAGRSTIGDHNFTWSQHDVFSIPHWTWASHEAQGCDADLFVVSDKSAYERLDLLREELQ